ASSPHRPQESGSHPSRFLPPWQTFAVRRMLDFSRRKGMSMKALLCVMAAAGLAAAQSAPKAAPGPGLTLTTTAFADGQEVPQKYTQSVANPISPKLEWTHVPAGTASFALIMYDPDTALQKTTNETLHWLVWNIPGDARE